MFDGIYFINLVLRIINLVIEISEFSIEFNLERITYNNSHTVKFFSKIKFANKIF